MASILIEAERSWPYGRNGCGKSTLGRVIVSLRMLKVNSKVYYRGVNVLTLDKINLKNIEKVQMIFQDPLVRLIRFRWGCGEELLLFTRRQRNQKEGTK